MKVGMLTTHGTLSHGGLLQTYALFKTIQHLGHESVLINYVPQMHDLKKHPVSFVIQRKHFLQKAVFGLLNYKELRRKQELTSEFRKKYLKVEPKTPVKLEKLPEELTCYDAVCVGSDQLWNLNQADNANKAYYLDFEHSRRTIAYAVSFGDGIVKKPVETEAALPLIRHFDFISVREREGLEYLASHGIEASLTIDPTLLAEPSVWRPFLGKPAIERGEYILVYGYSNANQSYDDLIAVAKDASSQLGIPVVNPVMTPSMDRAGFRNHYACGPGEFLNLVEHAAFVVTSSFHGCIFSYLLDRPFAAVFGKGSRDPRKETLLATLGLQDRAVIAGEQLDIAALMKHDYSNSTAALSSAKEQSLAFLRHALEKTLPIEEAPIKRVSRLTCTGCGACEACCPTGAIEMRFDREGFLFPFANNKTCIRCGACAKACPCLSPVKKNSRGKYLALQLLDRKALHESASGGAFYGLAQTVIRQGGAAVGCLLDSDLRPNHVIIYQEKDLRALQGSKYVQSRISRDVYRKIRDLLEKGCEVLFSGTPCQSAAIKNYLGTRYNNLYTIDLVCHGVGSPGIWMHYVAKKEQETGMKFTHAAFRSKDVAKHPNNRSMIFVEEHTAENGKQYSTVGGKAIDDPYGSSFYHNRILRECCYRCEYACERRVGDITLGDYDGDNRLPSDDGASFVSVNSARGEQLIKRAIDLFAVSSIPSSYSQLNLLQPTLRPASRDEMRVMKFDPYHLEADLNLRLRITVADRIKRFLPTELKTAVKKIVGRRAGGS